MTPVQIPFKRNFKDMENKFEYLKIDGREQLPAPWSDYPVLREYETVTVYRNGRDYLDALWDSRTAGGLPAFTWRWAVPAVVSTRDVNGDSLPPVRMPLWALGRMLCHEKLRGAARQAVLDRIDNIRQLTLF